MLKSARVPSDAIVSGDLELFGITRQITSIDCHAFGQHFFELQPNARGPWIERLVELMREATDIAKLRDVGLPLFKSDSGTLYRPMLHHFERKPEGSLQFAITFAKVLDEIETTAIDGIKRHLDRAM
jgi:hypothetical protein